MDLFDQVSEDIKNAMKAKDKVALETLRNIKKFFLEAKTAPGANDILTDDAALKIIQKLVKQGKDSAEIYIGQGRQDLSELRQLYRDYANRPSLLYYAEKMTKDLGGAKVYLKREDLNHTGAHKINNVLGQILLAKRMGKKRIIAETGATSGKDMGKVMGVASKKLAGLAEGRAISAKVKELLG
jgi:uncharacterized protein YqeY